MRIVVALGLRESSAPAGPLRPVLREIDTATGRIHREFRLDARLCASSEENQAFTAGWLDGRTLLQPTRTEILTFDIERWAPRDSISHPLFSDLHSVCPTQRDTWLVTATGHDSVLEVTPKGHIVQHWWLRDGDFERTFPANTDFRTIPFADLKPHAVHPNHAVEFGGRVWVTRMVQRRCDSVDGSEQLQFPEGPPHDGRPFGGRLWFTTIHGQVVSVDPQDPSGRTVLDAAAISGVTGGWWRGIAVTPSRIFIGRSALRAPRWNTWLKALAGRPPGDPRCEVVEFDFQTGRFIQRIDVGDAEGGQLYAIYPLEPDA
jgi:hypothetical protein